MAIRVIGATVGQLIMSPLHVAEAALGLKGGRQSTAHGTGGGIRGGTTIGKARGGFRGGGTSVGKMVAKKVGQAHAFKHKKAGLSRSTKMGRSAGSGSKSIASVRSYTKHTRTGRVIKVKGYKRPVGRRK